MPPDEMHPNVTVDPEDIILKAIIAAKTAVADDRVAAVMGDIRTQSAPQLLARLKVLLEKEATGNAPEAD